ncbi:hypothetical protein [Primorskyibacter sp. S187A]|uniref:hypothetical protein n=1 Tax=Primorskyibacter sp. S187A TaxID=3415130 RepID=UPI003C7E255E
MQTVMSCLAAGAIGLASAVCAEDLQLATDPFNETVSDTALIAGQFIAGLQFSSAPSEELALQAYIPAAWQSEILCARVITVEGQYLAANEYTVPASWAGGMTGVPYPKSTLNAALAGRPRDSVSVRLSRGACETRVTDVALTVWGEAQSAPGLLVNGFQAEQVYLYLGDSITPIACEPAPLETRIAYDTLCPLPPDTSSGPVDVSLLRIVDGEAAPREEITLWLP